MRSKKVRTTDCSSVGRANFPSLLDNRPAHPFSSSSLSLLVDDRFQSSLLRFVNETRKQTDHSFKPIFKVVDVLLYYFSSSRSFFPTPIKTSFFKKNESNGMSESSRNLLSTSSNSSRRGERRARLVFLAYNRGQKRERGREKDCLNLGQLAK